MKQSVLRILSIAFALSFLVASSSHAQVTLLAIGNLTGSRAGSLTDLSHLNYTLENGVAANYLGGFGSAITYAGGNTFLALPDRGPNAVPFDSNIDDTVSYINRFHTVTMNLSPNTSGSGLPFNLTPTLRWTTLLWNLSPLSYGAGDDLVGSGVPPLNNFFFHFFTGRSDNFDPSQNSCNPATPGSTLKAFVSRTTAEACSSPTSTVLTFISSTASPACASAPSRYLPPFA